MEISGRIVPCQPLFWLVILLDFPAPGVRNKKTTTVTMMVCRVVTLRLFVIRPTIITITITIIDWQQIRRQAKNL